MYTRIEEITHDLKSGVVKFEFEKSNGDHRVMYGSLHPAFLPERKPADPTKVPRAKSKNEDLVTVFDVESDAWRSFNFKGLVSGEILWIEDAI